MSTLNTNDCWNKNCLSCDCDGSWLFDNDVWTRFFEEHSQKLSRFFFIRLRGDEQAAQDCLQETVFCFIKQVKNGTFNYRLRVMPYMWRIAQNVFNDYLRRFRYNDHPVVSLEDIEYLGEEDDQLQVIEQLDIFDAFVKQAHLSAFQQEILILHYVNELKPGEIAILLNEPPQKVRNELFRANTKIREILEG